MQGGADPEYRDDVTWRTGRDKGRWKADRVRGTGAPALHQDFDRAVARSWTEALTSVLGSSRTTRFFNSAW